MLTLIVSGCLELRKARVTTAPFLVSLIPSRLTSLAKCTQCLTFRGLLKPLSSLMVRRAKPVSNANPRSRGPEALVAFDPTATSRSSAHSNADRRAARRCLNSARSRRSNWTTDERRRIARCQILDWMRVNPAASASAVRVRRTTNLIVTGSTLRSCGPHEAPLYGHGRRTADRFRASCARVRTFDRYIAI